MLQTRISFIYPFMPSLYSSRARYVAISYLASINIFFCFFSLSRDLYYFAASIVQIERFPRFFFSLSLFFSRE